MGQKRFRHVRAQSKALVSPLATENTGCQPIEDVSPPKWHLAHTTWFFETFLLKKFKPGYKVFNDRFDYLFNSYYESIGERVLRKDRGNLTRPTLEEILQYRDYVDSELMDYLEGSKPTDECLNLLELGLNHEEQHQELLVTDIKFILGTNPLRPAYHSQPLKSFPPLQTNYDPINEGLYEIGHSSPHFSYDNERGVHQVYLPAFQIMSRLVTNEEYLAFMEEDGYRRPEFWHAEGWDWLKRHRISAPLYWIQDGKTWHHYTLSGTLSLNLKLPVCHVSFYEASAFAEWKKMRLPTEFEWEVAAKHLSGEIPETANFMEKNLLHPESARSKQYFGDVWEWTGSAYLPYPHFKKEAGAVGEYNGKFMVNQMVLRGGSCATPKDHIRPTYRNFFHPDKQWQFSGIRLAQSLEGETK